MKKTIHSVHAPKAIGPYSQAIQVNDTVYFSGQIALDPETMQLVSGDISAETKQVFNNLQVYTDTFINFMNKFIK